MIINGKKTAQLIFDELKEKVSKLSEKPTIAVIIVGENPASKIYVKIKHKKAMELGMNSLVVEMPENTTQEDLLLKIEELNKNPNVNAILVQMPLPAHINTYQVLEKISPIKDVDGFTFENVAKNIIGIPPNAYSCTPKGILRLLEDYSIEIEGKNVLIIGRSNIVGKPLAAMFLNKNATITVAHSKTKNLEKLARNADIVVAAVGIPKFVKASWIKENAVVIDVGITRLEDKTLVGDVDFEEVAKKASFITPVPGGVGPMTIIMLLENTLELFLLQKKEQK